MIEQMNGWLEVKPIKKSNYLDEFHTNYAQLDDKMVYFDGIMLEINNKYFINESQIIAYECN